MNSIDLEKLNRPGRFAEIAQLHVNAFNWRPQGRIPLGIHVVDPEHAGGLDYGEWLNPEPFLEFQAKVLADTLAVGSDLLPAVAINHLGDAVLPSMFGAEMYLPEKAGATLQDVGPASLPVFPDIQQVASLGMPGLEAGIMPDVLRIASYYREKLPDWVRVVAPMPVGGFSTAMLLRGSELLFDLLDQPALCHKLIGLCARLQVEVERHVRMATGAPLALHVTNFGIRGAGLRLAEDSMVNLSPAMIEEFCLPAFACVNRLCGGRGHVHFCSLPHSRFEHIYSALLDMPEVAVVSSQFGFEYYEQHVDELRGRLAVESFYGDAYPYVQQKHGSFKDWADDFVPRFKNESGLVLYCQAQSVEEGQGLWAAWDEAHGK